MVSADMCKHDWPGTSCPDCRREEEAKKTSVTITSFDVAAYVSPPAPTDRQHWIPGNTVWEYKNAYYRTIRMEEALSQDPETGEWGPTVRYQSEKPDVKPQFLRAASEFARKFRRVS